MKAFWILFLSLGILGWSITLWDVAHGEQLDQLRSAVLVVIAILYLVNSIFEEATK